MVPALRRYSTTLGACFTLSALLLSGCASSPRTAFDSDPATRQAVERAKGGDGAALQSLHDAALAGKGSAAYAVGLGLAEGWNGPPDIGQALAWWQRAADQGDADAMNALAVAYAEGLGVAPDSARARQLWQQAAAQGHPTAQYNLGSLLVSQAETRADMAAAAGWLRQAADQGDSDAQYFLANLYDSGEGVPRQPDEAMRLWREAAANGHADAAYSLGEAYLSGTTGSVDVSEAQRWMKRAAAAGHPQAAATVALLARGDVPDPVVIARRGRGLPSRVTEVADAVDDSDASASYRAALAQRSQPLRPAGPPAQLHYKGPSIRTPAAAVASRKPDAKAARTLAERGKADRRSEARLAPAKGAKPAASATRGKSPAPVQVAGKPGKERVVLAAARPPAASARANAAKPVPKPAAAKAPPSRQVAANTPRARPAR